MSLLQRQPTNNSIRGLTALTHSEQSSSAKSRFDCVIIYDPDDAANLSVARLWFVAACGHLVKILPVICQWLWYAGSLSPQSLPVEAKDGLVRLPSARWRPEIIFGFYGICTSESWRPPLSCKSAEGWESPLICWYGGFRHVSEGKLPHKPEIEVYIAIHSTYQLNVWHLLFGSIGSIVNESGQVSCSR
jgi:hypothetical protein